MPQLPPQKLHQACNQEARLGRILRQPLERRDQLWSEAFVRVQVQLPRVAQRQMVDSPVSLCSIAFERMLHDLGSLLLAERDGIDLQLAAKVMADSPIGSPMLKLRVPLMLDPPDQAWFDMQLMHKDIRLARESGVEHKTPLPSAEVADEVLSEAEELGYGHRDIANVFQVLGQLANTGARVGS